MLPIRPQLLDSYWITADGPATLILDQIYHIKNWPLLNGSASRINMNKIYNPTIDPKVISSLQLVPKYVRRLISILKLICSKMAPTNAGDFSKRIQFGDVGS